MFERITRYLSRRSRPKSETDEHDPALLLQGEENILLMSDLHLGEACKDLTRIEYLKTASDLDHHILLFLEYFTHHRMGDRPWRLILAGDVFDFLQVTVTPESASAHEAVYGLGTNEQSSVWKLSKLMDRHRLFFIHLADFIAAGHSVDIVRGNHDEELFWPAVKVAFLDGLKTLYFGDEAGAKCNPQEFELRVRFHEWFLYLPRFLYVEHGHRFDEFCSTPPQIAPLRPNDQDELAQPLSALAIRYFANLEPGFQTHDKEHWGLFDYFKYFRERGDSTASALFKRYVFFARECLRYHLDHGRHQAPTAKKKHASAAAMLAEKHGISPEKMKGLEGLAPTNVMVDPVGVIANVCLFEAAAGLATVLTLPIGMLCGLSFLGSFGTAAGMALLSFGSSALHRKKYDRNIREKLRKAADEIGRLLDVPVVCFGHSHAPLIQRQRHRHRHYYVNSGSFLKVHGPVHAPDEPCNCGYTFLMMEAPDEHEFPKPNLYRWCGVNAKALPVDVNSS